LSADGLEKLKRAMNDSAVMAWRLPIVDVGREADGCSHVPRFYRNAPGLFYIGRVHEQVFSSLEVRRGEWGLENRIGDAMLIHHGYTVEVTRDRNKIERNLGMLERAVQELPDEPHLLMNLGLELARSGREAEALGRYREAFDSLSSKPAAEIVPELRETLLMQLSARLAAAKRFDEVVRVLNSPLAGMHGGLTASLHFSLGLAQLELRQFIEAADQMRQCLAKRLQRSLAPINREINTAAPHHCLALCLVKSGEAAAAEKAFQDGLKETGHGDALRLEYARFLAGQNRPVDALHRLNEVVAGNALHAEAWQLGGQIALGRPEFLEFARDWTGEAIRQLPDDSIIFAQRAEALLLSQETTAALPLWNRAVNGERPPRAVAAQILCATLTSQTIEGLCDQAEEAAVSRAFVDWYRCLVAAGARDAIVSLNSRVETLRPVLPSAAGILDGVNAETRKNTTAVADVS
jgi:tetratricopeptide (TPR) repeat protein